MLTTIAPRATPSTLSAPSERTAIEIDGLTKRFPVRRSWLDTLRAPTRREFAPAVSGVTCTIRTGEFFGVLGPNGAGKTTLFKILCGSILPDAGRASVFGRDVESDAAEVRRMVGSVMANDRSLSWRLSAVENMRLFATLHGLRGSERTRRVNELLEGVDLRDTGEKMVGTFSTGMKQRLLIARALLARPALLLLDEPTRSLDPISARSFRSFLRTELAAREGCTILLATHSGEEAMELCDRVAIMDRGRLLALGTAEEIGREVGGERFALWTTAPEHPAIRSLMSQGVATEIAMLDAEADGWSCVHLVIPGGPPVTARVVDVLTCAGVPVARFERAPLSLADLIDRVVKRATGEER